MESGSVKAYLKSSDNGVTPAPHNMKMTMKINPATSRSGANRVPAPKLSPTVRSSDIRFFAGSAPGFFKIGNRLGSFTLVNLPEISPENRKLHLI